MIKCPKCGSENTSREKSIYGYYCCFDCSYVWRYGTKLPEPTTAEKLLWLWNNVCFERQSYSTIFYTADVTKPELRLYEDDFSSPDDLIATAYSWAKEQQK